MLNIIYIVILFLFSVYSYSQIDLNLTLSGNSVYQFFQNQLIYLGYFNRPLSAFIYLLIIFLLFTFYFLLLYIVIRQKISIKKIAYLIIISCAVLFFSYSAFSHDIFNYMFDARIVTTYHQNPYLHSALDFPTDLWTRFMHWTHRTYPYGPIWLLLTLPASFLGFGKFVLTLINFKLLFTVFHLGNIYFIHKILSKIAPKKTLLGVVFYAFNPLILIESLVSPHNEVVMLFFLLMAIYFMITKKNQFSTIIILLLSAGIKFVTLILLPVFLIPIFIPSVARDLSKRFNLLLILIFLFLIPPLLYEIYLREPYSWYFIPIIGIGALLINYTKVCILLVGISLGTLLRYVPYFYTGEYSQSVRNTQDSLFLLTVILTIGVMLLSLRGTHDNA